MDTNERVIDYIKDIAEYVQTKEGRISASQDVRAIFVYTGNAVYTGVQFFRWRKAQDFTFSLF